MIKEIWKRGTIIRFSHVGKVYKVHFGHKEFKILKVLRNMVGSRFGEMVGTRKYNREFYKRTY